MGFKQAAFALLLLGATSGCCMRFTNTDADTFWVNHLSENATPPLPYEHREMDFRDTSLGSV